MLSTVVKGVRRSELVVYNHRACVDDAKVAQEARQFLFAVQKSCQLVVAQVFHIIILVLKLNRSALCLTNYLSSSLERCL